MPNPKGSGTAHQPVGPTSPTSWRFSRPRSGFIHPCPRNNPRADEAILPARENSRKHRQVINIPWSTMEFDHVARHHQPDLPPGLQKLSGRSCESSGRGPDNGALVAAPKNFEHQFWSIKWL
jgi:hypothetical protein